MAPVNMALAHNQPLVRANTHPATHKPHKVQVSIHPGVHSNQAQPLHAPALGQTGGLLSRIDPLISAVTSLKAHNIRNGLRKSNVLRPVKSARKSWPHKLHCPKSVALMSRWIFAHWLKSYACVTPKSSSICS